MTQESSTSTPIPMAPLSSPVVPEHAPSSQPTPFSSASASVSRTSLVITIVTTEQVPHSSKDNDGTTTTVERELKLRLTLPAAYDTKQLKSLNVKLHQDPVTNAVYPAVVSPTPYGNHCEPGYVPYSVPSFYKDPAVAQQQQWQQEQLRLFQANNQVMPEAVSSFYNNGVNTHESTTESSMPRPDSVSSSSSNNSTKRRRTRSTPATTTTTQSNSRKKRKIAKNGKANHPTPQ